MAKSKPISLVVKLNEIKSNLEELNIFVPYNTESKDQAKDFSHLQNSARSARSVQTPDSHSKQPNFANPSANATESEHKVAFDKDTENHIQISFDTQDAKSHPIV